MIQEITIEDDGTFPGSKLPVLFYKSALMVPMLFPATHISNLFDRFGWWNSWDAGIFTYHHYHSNTHEVMGVYSGSTTIQLGGPNGPKIELEKGDVIVIPAGVAHINLGKENDVKVVGAYPKGKNYDMNCGHSGERPETDGNIANCLLPETDPLSGDGGELVTRWQII